MSPTTWLPQEDLLAHLRISRRQIHLMRREGILKAGDHFIRKGLGPRGSLLFDLAACEQALRDDAAKRAQLWETYSPF